MILVNFFVQLLEKSEENNREIESKRSQRMTNDGERGFHSFLALKMMDYWVE